MGFDEATLERFWRKVDKSAGPDGCWPWLGRIDRYGYGKFKLVAGNGGMVSAHRVSLTVSVGTPTPEKRMALHSCDRPACCNPAHLRWGNNSDNVGDRYVRNHAWRNQNANHCRQMSLKLCKLNPSQADYIKRLHLAGYSTGECAEWYGVSRNTVLRLVRGKTKIYADTTPLQTTNEKCEK